MLLSCVWKDPITLVMALLKPPVPALPLLPQHSLKVLPPRRWHLTVNGAVLGKAEPNAPVLQAARPAANRAARCGNWK